MLETIPPGGDSLTSIMLETNVLRGLAQRRSSYGGRAELVWQHHHRDSSNATAEQCSDCAISKNALILTVLEPGECPRRMILELWWSKLNGIRDTIANHKH